MRRRISNWVIFLHTQRIVDLGKIHRRPPEQVIASIHVQALTHRLLLVDPTNDGGRPHAAIWQQIQEIAQCSVKPVAALPKALTLVKLDARILVSGQDEAIGRDEMPVCSNFPFAYGPDPRITVEDTCPHVGRHTAETRR
jgi:hypothetical protein